MSEDDIKKVKSAKKHLQNGAVSVTVALSDGTFKTFGKKPSRRKLVTKWEKENISEYRQWHEQLMNDLGYPFEIQYELRANREQFLGMVS